MVMVMVMKKDNYVDGDSTSDDYEYGNDDGDNNSFFFIFIPWSTWSYSSGF